jgi:hypothetical protein
VPDSIGVRDVPGDAGVVEFNVGAGGGTLSST